MKVSVSFDKREVLCILRTGLVAVTIRGSVLFYSSAI